ncbi:17083_t:CDS:1 [Funneliformis caledonium]|uniref:17083_t:CDS:1 n=1 Tax=Funneliformis caledonium TaxID=1117310 RepID=A0A9N9FGN0_9GLOM|nr:17083_t:CDS:1 [Funneliformis caledonium]
MASLLLMIWLSVNGVNGGENLKECVSHDTGFYSQYDTVVNFASNIADKQLFCCNVPIGSTDVGCSPMSPNCPYYPNYFRGQCNTIGQSKFCVTQAPEGFYVQSSSQKINLPGGLCGGIIGNNSPTNATVGECPNASAISNTLVNQRTAATFSWLCCGKDTCRVPANVQVTNTLSAITGCFSDEWSMMCFNDNGGWGCTGNVSPNIENITLPIGSCVVQVVFPRSDTTSPSSSSDVSKPTSSDISKPTSSGISKPFGRNYSISSILKIVIPVLGVLFVLVAIIYFVFVRNRNTTVTNVQTNLEPKRGYIHHHIDWTERV